MKAMVRFIDKNLATLIGFKFLFGAKTMQDHNYSSLACFKCNSIHGSMPIHGMMMTSIPS